MDLERLSISLRPRNSWEAADLGIRLAITHWRPLYAAWLGTCLPVVLVLFLICHYWLESLVWFYFLTWWCKPLLDRVALHVISHAVFGSTPSVRQTMEALPRLLWSTRVGAGLLWNWCNPLRPVTMGVDVLEGLHGTQARARKSLIRNRVTGTGLIQSFLFFWVLQPVLWFATLSLAVLIVPDNMWPSSSGFSDFLAHSPEWFDILLCCLLIGWNLVLEPLYVASGFMLYIKRRTDLEAWDVELKFRRLAQINRAQQASTLITRLLVPLIAACCLGSMLLVPEAHAQSPSEERERAVHAAPQLVNEVLQDARFGHMENRRELTLKKSAPSRKVKKTDSDGMPAWLKNLIHATESVVGGLFALIASLARGLLWTLILLVVILVLFLATRFGWSGRHRSARNAPPAELAGFDIRPQSLPDDIAQTALTMLQQNQVREALSLLFRGALSHLAHQDQVPFARGDTEGDCLAHIHRHAPVHSGFMTRLLGCWQRLAYAHATIGTDEVQQLCAGWQHEFGGGRRA